MVGNYANIGAHGLTPDSAGLLAGTASTAFLNYRPTASSTTGTLSVRRDGGVSLVLTDGDNATRDAQLHFGTNAGAYIFKVSNPDFIVLEPNASREVWRIVRGANAAFVVNDQADSGVDFRVEGVGHPSALFVDGANGAVSMSAWLNVGTTTLAVAQGDFAVGTTTNLTSWDESTGTLRLQSNVANRPLLILDSNQTTPRDWYLFVNTAGQFTIYENDSAAARIVCATAETVINEPGADHDFRVEGDSNANLFVVDAGLDALQTTFLTTRASSASATLNVVNWQAGTTTITGITNITTATGFNAFAIGVPTYSNASITIDSGATVYIAGAPAVTGGMALTNAYALWIDSGTARFDGSITTAITDTHVVFSTAGILTGDAGFTFNPTTDTLALGSVHILSVGGHSLTLDTTDFAIGTTTAKYLWWDNSASNLIVANSSADTLISLQATTSGDPYIRFRRISATDFSLGIDDSDSDAFVLTAAANLDGVNLLRILTTGATTIAQWLNVGTSTSAVAQGDFSTGLTGAARLFYNAATGQMLASTTAGLDVLNFVAANPSLTIGSTTSTGTAVLRVSNDGTSGSGPMIAWMRAGTDNWLQYQSASTTLFLRDAPNARMHVTYVPGATVLASTTTFNGSVIVSGYILGGTSTVLVNAQGDFSTGITGASQLAYDQSANTLTMYGASAAIFNQFSSVAGTPNVLNETGADIDTRIEGVGNANLFVCDAGLAAIGIGTDALSDRKIYVYKQWSITSGSGYGIIIRADSDPASTSTAGIVGLRATSSHNTAFNCNAIYGLEALAQTTVGFTAGTLSWLRGLNVEMTFGGTGGATTNAAGVYVAVPTAAATDPSNYAQVWLADPGVVGSSINCGVRQQGTTAHNRFNGNTKFGADATPNAAYAVDITGALLGSTFLNYGGTAVANATGEASFGTSTEYLLLEPSGISANTALTLHQEAPGGIGPALYTYWQRAGSPGANDVVARWLADGNDTTSTQTTYGRLDIIITSPSNPSETGRFEFSVAVSGTLTERFAIYDGECRAIAGLVAGSDAAITSGYVLDAVGAIRGTTYINVGGTTVANATGEVAFGTSTDYMFFDPATSGTLLLEGDDAGALGPVFRTYHNSASPAASDVLARWLGDGESSTGATVNYGRLDLVAATVTNGSEDAYWSTLVMDGGALTERLRVANNDVYLGGITGDYVRFEIQTTPTLLLQSGVNNTHGPYWQTYHARGSANVAANDIVIEVRHTGDETGGGSLHYGAYRVVIDNATTATAASHWEFDVYNSGPLATAQLLQTGVWQDASSAKIKHYLSDWTWKQGSALDTIRALDTGVYEGVGSVGQGPLHISPTAERWREVTGARGSMEGLAPKDIAGLGLLGIVELDNKLSSSMSRLENQYNSIESEIKSLKERVSALEAIAA